MAEVLVDLEPVITLSRPIAFSAEQPVLVLAIASDTTPAAYIGGDMTADVSISGTLTTETVTPIPLTATLDIDTDSSGDAYSYDTIQTEAAYRERIVNTSPWLYWPMDEGTGTTLNDDSGNGRDGTVGGGPVWVTTDSTSMGAKALNLPSTAYGATNASALNLTTSYQGFGFAVTFRMTPALVNYGAAMGLSGAWTSFLFHCSFTGQILIGHSASNRIDSGASTITANTWVRLVYSQSPTGKANLWVNGRLIRNATSIAVPTANGTGVNLYNNTIAPTNGSDFQHMAIWNRELTWDEQRTIAPADITEVTPVALSGSTDADVSFPNAELTAITSVPAALEATLDADVDLSLTTTSFAIEGSLDVDVDTDAVLPVTFTTFVGIEGSMDVDASTDDALLRGSKIGTMTATAPAVLTLQATTGTPVPNTVLALEPLTLELDTNAVARKIGAIYTPPAPESASTTDPAVATGIVVRALMGVAAVMETPAITDGKPSS